MNDAPALASRPTPARTGARPPAAARLLTAAAGATLATSGAVHAQLYLDGYRYLHAVGVLFLLQAAASFGLGALLVAGVLLRPPAVIHLAAAGTALGALTGFAASRTIGVFGFIEHGLQPAPQALISIVTECVTVLALLAAGYLTVRHQQAPVSRPPSLP
ncbi:hypothetical protein OG762_44240 [Streptomyces sp. NBC_01136]|uniref:hypothetical protein n=1 Tax=unclassified Streptomyces TaxID=2593676 RepID=UPI00324ECCE2|nr:hypothetical protein OG762_44240 [Streptomyces sp. NBC_01136]